MWPVETPGQVNKRILLNHKIRLYSLRGGSTKTIAALLFFGRGKKFGLFPEVSRPPQNSDWLAMFYRIPNAVQQEDPAYSSLSRPRTVGNSLRTNGKLTSFNTFSSCCDIQ